MLISDWSSDVCSSDLCDFLIAVGARFDDRVAGNPARFAPGAKAIAHLDIDPSEINKVKRVQWHHVGELNAALKSLQQYATAQGYKPDYTAWHTHIAEHKQHHPMNHKRGREPLQTHPVKQ